MNAKTVVITGGTSAIGEIWRAQNCRRPALWHCVTDGTDGAACVDGVSERTVGAV